MSRTRHKKRKLPVDLGREIGQGNVVRLLEFIEGFWGDYGHSPTTREIAEGLELTSPSVAWYWVEAAKRKGLVTKTGAKRSFQVTFAGRKLLGSFADDSREQLLQRIRYHERRAEELRSLLNGGD